MTTDELSALFDADDEFIKFDRVPKKRSQRPDIHAFLLLDELVPGATDMVSAAEHDEIYLEVDPEALAKVITKEQVIELQRCGVRYDSANDSLCMFV